MRVQVGLPVVETNHQPQTDHVGLQRVHETPAERIARKRPPQGVDHRVQRFLRLPDLLDAESVNLGILRLDLLPLDIRFGQGTPTPFRKGCDPRNDVGAGRVARRLPPIAIQTGGSSTDANHSFAAHEQFLRREPSEHVHSQLFGLLAQPTDHFTERGGVVPVIAHRGRRWQTERAVLGEQVHRLVLHGLAERKVLIL